MWHTFIGGDRGDGIHAITLDSEGRLWLAGASRNTWGTPVIPHPGGDVGNAAFVAVLSEDGQCLGNTFVGGPSSSDRAYGIALTQQDDIYIVGASWSPESVGWGNPLWETPIRAFSGSHDAFVAGLDVQSVVRYWLYAPLILKY
jgi:hypothetical protein